MTKKIKMAINWAGACGGCDVALLDTQEKILGLTELVDVVYWPVAMDFKREDLKAFAPGEIDVGLFNGVIRTSEQEEDARIMRSRCRVLIAFGACAAFGGIPGLANLVARQDLLDCVYRDTASTDNPDDVRPQTQTATSSGTLELPEFSASVKALKHVVDVDLTIPGCPPPMDLVAQALDAIVAYARTGRLPPKGTVLAGAKALCDTCPRIETRSGKRIKTFRRPHEVVADPDLCFLEQGILCLGMATRGGCGNLCIEANMPCRGCFGPIDTQLDPAAEALSAIGSLAAESHEDELAPNKRLAPVKSLADLAATFYRFSLPCAAVFRSIDDKPNN